MKALALLLAIPAAIGVAGAAYLMGANWLMHRFGVPLVRSLWYPVLLFCSFGALASGLLALLD